MNSLKTICATFVCALIAASAAGQVSSNAGATASKEAAWQRLKPYFKVPQEYQNDFGGYRSPLKFYDGRQVKNKSQWKERREEILNRWHDLMGHWPALVENPVLQFLDSTRRESFTQYRVSLQWTPNERTEGYLLVPEGARGRKNPAVITVFYEPETAIGNGKPERDFALQLARKGFITLSLGTTEASEAKTYSLYYPGIDNATIQPLSMLAYAAANAWTALANVAFVDSTRIGIMGHSFGGKWAMFASCLWDKFACAVWSDPGIVFESDRPSVNYWEPWYLGYHPKPWRTRGLITSDNPSYGLYSELVSKGYDLHELHALMAPRPFLVSGGEEDPPRRWVPLNHTIRVNRKLGYKNRVGMTNRPTHSPDVNSNEVAVLFFEYFLK